MHSSGFTEQVRQSGWQEEHDGEVPLDWKKPVGQLRADWQAPLTTSCPDGHDVQKSADPSQVAQVLEQAISHWRNGMSQGPGICRESF